jgi:hypothetical protein
MVASVGSRKCCSSSATTPGSRPQPPWCCFGSPPETPRVVVTWLRRHPSS